MSNVTVAIFCSAHVKQYRCGHFLFYLGWSENGEHVAVGGEHLKVDCLQDLIWSIEFQEEHDENAVVGNLLEISGSHVMIYQENSSNYSKNLVQKIDLI